MSHNPRMKMSRTELRLTTTGTPPLFAVLPAGLFAPLAAANRERYWELLYRLFEQFFGPDAPLPPSIGFQRRELPNRLSSRPRRPRAG